VVDSRVAVEALVEVDPGFVTLCKTLMGDAIDPNEAWEFMYGRERIIKMSPDMADLSTKGSSVVRGLRGKIVPVGAGVVVGAAGTTAARSKKKKPKVVERDLTKADDIIWMGEFSKVDDDKRQVFGWASIVEIGGEPVVDRQGDLMDAEEIEKAAYAYVQKSRKGGHQHKRTEDDQPFHASNMIESIVFTDEKVSKMGLPDDFPRGWWVGYKVEDEETWQKVKKREVTGFSIHGKGKRVEV
jgi:hypothetical protein